MAKILYQGHASLRLETKEGRFIYIDPYAGEGYDKPSSLVLITHEHYDHNGIHLVPLTTRTIVIRAKDALDGLGYHSFSYFGVSIEAVPAFNKNHNVNECVGFLLTLEGKKIYVAGDTDYTPEMERLGKEGLDYAFLPIDGVYNMGPEEATRCADILKPKHLIPYHMHPGMLFDIKQDMKVTYSGAMLVRPGEIIDL